MSLKEQELLFEAATSEAFRRLAEWVKDPGYREILKGWIVEAAVGLEAEKALVATSQAEARHMDDALLREAGEAGIRPYRQEGCPFLRPRFPDRRAGNRPFG